MSIVTLQDDWSACCEHHAVLQGACQIDRLQRVNPAAGSIVPLWHLRALVALVLTVATVGTLVGQAAAPGFGASSRITGAYLPMLIVSVGLSLFVCRFGLERSIFSQLWASGGYDYRRLLGDMAWAVALGVGLIAAENALEQLFGLPTPLAAHALMPVTRSEKAAWLLVALLVGFSEELVYRGYFQRQFAALAGQASFGLVAQAALFGIAHAQQGAWAVSRFAVYALGLGLVAAKRRSLLPVVLCHVALDGYAGLSA
jgi:membrane protease YdiL (CAAX protease family)